MRTEKFEIELFPQIGISEADRLYIIGNGFDIHHDIKSRYSHFKEWLQVNKNDSLVNMMDVFFSNERDFWSNIEMALGEYDEEEITEYCEPEDSQDFKFDHPGQWQARVEDSIPYIFGGAMAEFRSAFTEWVRSIDIEGIEADLQMPQSSRYLSFNYTETLEKTYGVPAENVLHIHGSRLERGAEFVIGHSHHRDVNEPFGDEGKLLPYQNAYSSVIGIMNEWNKGVEGIISSNQLFFGSLCDCKGVCVIGISYNDIDMPYLKAVSESVTPDAKWVLNYYSERDKENALKTVKILGLTDYAVKQFE